jgi:hypothetical protein
MIFQEKHDFGFRLAKLAQTSFQNWPGLFSTEHQWQFAKTFLGMFSLHKLA